MGRMKHHTDGAARQAAFMKRLRERARNSLPVPARIETAAGLPVLALDLDGDAHIRLRAYDTRGELVRDVRVPRG